MQQVIWVWAVTFEMVVVATLSFASGCFLNVCCLFSRTVLVIRGIWNLLL